MHHYHLPHAVKKCVQADDCVQEGATLNYDCIVEDAEGYGATIWTGDSFKCTDSLNQILLAHSFYTSEGIATIPAVIFLLILSKLMVLSTCTSTLFFFGDSALSLNGTTINCTLSGVFLVKVIAVKVGGEL